MEGALDCTLIRNSFVHFPKKYHKKVVMPKCGPNVEITSFHNKDMFSFLYHC